METTTVWTFFYGSYINLEVLREVELTPRDHEVARLPGFQIRIEPLANLVRSDLDCVYGIVARVTHAELARLYEHAEQVLGGVYLPEAQVVETLDGRLRPALCYISHSTAKAPAANDYIDRIVGPAKAFGFPSAYVGRLEQFRPD